MRFYLTMVDTLVREIHFYPTFKLYTHTLFTNDLLSATDHLLTHIESSEVVFCVGSGSFLCSQTTATQAARLDHPCLVTRRDLSMFSPVIYAV